MTKYIIKRLFWAIIVLIGILSTTFIFLKLQPIYPPTEEGAKKIWLAAQESHGYMTSFAVTSASDILRWQSTKNVYVVFESKAQDVLLVYRTVPIFTQYWSWLKNILLHFDWGTSSHLSVNIPVTDILKSAISYSFQVNIFVLIIEIPIGLLLGIFSALKKDSVFDNIVQIVIMVFISLPSFVVIVLMMKWLGSDLSWVPYTWVSNNAPMSQKILRFVIPVGSMVFGGIAGLTRSVRAELAEGLTSEYVLLARTKGLTKRQSIFHHALRNSLLPIIPGLIFSFVGLMSGSAIIERVYGIPGAGALILTALQRGPDVNIIMYDTAFFGVIGLTCAVFMDITYGIIDPRIKMGAANG